MSESLKRTIPGFSVKNHWLQFNGQVVNTKISPNKGGLITPEIVVCHYTGSDSLQGALSWLCNPAAKVSAHLVISKTGEVWQLLPFNVRAWHAGASEYDGRPNVNNFSIGIEHVGIGGDYPDAQITASIGVVRALFRAYGLIDCVGHADICVPPGRKSDPGELYWERMAEMGAWE